MPSYLVPNTHVQRWLKQNCKARWDLMENHVLTDVAYRGIARYAVEFSMAFQDEKNAIRFKLWWHR